jgi:hypothetical protein
MYNVPIEQIHEYLVKELMKCKDTATLNYFLLMYNRFDDEFVKHHRLKEVNKKDEVEVVNEEELMEKSIMCKKEMPFCLCNKSGDVKKGVVFGCLWCKEDVEVIEDYFGEVWKGEREVKEVKEVTPQSVDEMLIERHGHHCEEYLKKRMEKTKGEQ